MNLNRLKTVEKLKIEKFFADNMRHISKVIKALLISDSLKGTERTTGGEYDCKRAGGCFKDLNDNNICPPELRLVKNGRVSDNGDKNSITLRIQQIISRFIHRSDYTLIH